MIAKSTAHFSPRNTAEDTIGVLNWICLPTGIHGYVQSKGRHKVALTLLVLLLPVQTAAKVCLPPGA